MLSKIERFVFENKNDWQQVRKGLFTASRIAEIMPNGRILMSDDELAAYVKLNPKSKAKYKEDERVVSDGALTYILEIIQGLEGAPAPQFYNAAMEWGNEQEPAAVMRYCEDYGHDLHDNEVIYTSQGGTVFFVGDNLLGCTPDLILKDRLVQVKCPDSRTHLRYKLFLNEDNFKEKEEKYYWQMQLEMLLAERPICDFYSFDPRFDRDKMQSHKIEIRANKEDQEAIIRKAIICEARKQELLNQLK
jgi:hypothetical protein